MEIVVTAMMGVTLLVLITEIEEVLIVVTAIVAAMYDSSIGDGIDDSSGAGNNHGDNDGSALGDSDGDDGVSTGNDWVLLVMTVTVMMLMDAMVII